VGRGGIKRRKRKRSLPEAEASEGIIEDLQDQAEWSSYTQQIPPLGNPAREAIWWNRGWRYWRGLIHVRDNRTLRSSLWWTAVRSGIYIVAGAVAVIWLASRFL
jgi:hypothetical protein